MAITPTQVAAWDAQRGRLKASATARKHSPEQAFRHEVCAALQVGTSATNEKLMVALDAAVGTSATPGQPDQAQLQAAREHRAGQRARAKLAAADQAGDPDDVFYETLFPSTKASDATEGLSAEEAAFYRELFPTDSVTGVAEADSDEAAYRALFPDER